jgi:diaminohydroxyphosphoribosylaminopyrimidine deaminase/5-amino-6-(5-phosphoribosylamino)uracil reductase|uniref:Riboflavin biosynthesis protein RibD n=1 Tax=Desulfobacca acetoxidans TaxID=60893 RepID=A0A7C5EN69_9BACT
MQTALRLAARGAGWVSPNPMVGAVVVREGEVIGRGWHRRYGAPHAEVEALAMAGDKARGATLYVTLEPCNHYGQTPPCTAAILAAGVRRVVVATLDPNPAVTGGGAEFLRKNGIQVDLGLLASEARRLNEAWFKWLETGLPFVIAKAACSLDGKVATTTGDSQWLTGELARAFGHHLRHACDAILVGVGTVLADDPQLTTRLPRRRGKDPIRVVLDSRLRLPLTARLLHLKSSAPTWIATTSAAPPDKIKALEGLRAEVLVLPAEEGQVALKPLLRELGRRQVQSLLVEGGPEVLGSFFDQRLVDKFYFFYAPKILGGREAYPAVAGRGAARLIEAPQLTNLSIRRLGPDLMVSGYPIRAPGPGD